MERNKEVSTLFTVFYFFLLFTVKRCHAKINFELLNNIKIKILHLIFRIMLFAQSTLHVCLPGDEKIECLSGTATQRSGFIWLLRTPGSFGLGENSGPSA